MAIATWSPDGKLGAISLRAAGATDVNENGTAAIVGKGKLRIVTNITALEIASNDEHYTIKIQANTAAATSTWYDLATLFSGGAFETTGESTDDVVDEHEVIIDNPHDYQIRTHLVLVGSVATGINFTCDAYRLLSQY